MCSTYQEKRLYWYIYLHSCLSLRSKCQINTMMPLEFYHRNFLNTSTHPSSGHPPPPHCIMPTCLTLIFVSPLLLLIRTKSQTILCLISPLLVTCFRNTIISY